MKKILFLSLALLTLQLVYGQRGYTSLTYSIGLPTGSLSEYIDDVSYRGMTAEFYWHVKKSLDAGLEVGWNVFYSKEDSKAYTSETASISGVQFRYTNAVPILAAARWRLMTGNLEPYVGAGVGTSSINRSTDFGLYRISNNSWQFCVRPEAGIMFKLGDTFGATAGIKYYANFENDKLEGQTYFTGNVGFVFQWGH